MSVINTMLKDLERRGVECAGSDDKILGGLSTSHNAAFDEEPSHNIYLLGLLGMTTILSIIIAAYYLSPYQLIAVAQQKPEAPSDAMVRSEPEPRADDEPPTLATQPEAEMAETTSVAASTTKNPTVVANQNPSTQSLPQPSSTTLAQHPTSLAVKPVEPKKPIPQVATVNNKSARPAPRTAQIVAENAHEQDDLSVETSSAVSKQQRDFTPEEKSRQAYATALTLYKQDRKQQAKAKLTTALDFSAGNADASRLLTIIYLEAGRADLAAEAIEKGLAMHADDQTLLRLYLQTLVQQGNYQAAVTVMEQRLRLTTPEDLAYLAGLYQKNNNHLNAVKLYAQALQLIPSKSIWWMGQGISFEVIGRYKEALQSYEKAMSTGQLSSQLFEYTLQRINDIKQHNAASLS
ncbi:MAG: tetratricopeptide repeat protein [Gammaproteobacteria bacterium]|jgi:Flp pilus assembly protein TadD|nr:tetratricopeptide repeat protein [Gammaproteobacteria bacterium]